MVDGWNGVAFSVVGVEVWFSCRWESVLGSVLFVLLQRRPRPGDSVYCWIVRQAVGGRSQYIRLDGEGVIVLFFLFQLVSAGEIRGALLLLALVPQLELSQYP